MISSDRWQSLEHKGGAEAKVLCVRHIGLEVHAKTLEGHLAKVEKLKEAVEEWKVSTSR